MNMLNILNMLNFLKSLAEKHLIKIERNYYAPDITYQVVDQTDLKIDIYHQRSRIMIVFSHSNKAISVDEFISKLENAELRRAFLFNLDLFY